MLQGDWQSSCIAAGEYEIGLLEEMNGRRMHHVLCQKHLRLTTMCGLREWLAQKRCRGRATFRIMEVYLTVQPAQRVSINGGEL